MAQEFIEFFTKRGETVLDPMAGTGSTLVAALRAGRNSYGIELNPNMPRSPARAWPKNANRWVSQREDLNVRDHYWRCQPCAATFELPTIDYVLTSPPYWDMLRAKGAGTQKKRRTSTELDVFYSDDPDDLGNLDDYEEFLAKLVAIYHGLKPLATGESLSHHHRQECKKRRQDLSAGLGPGPRAWQGVHAQG